MSDRCMIREGRLKTFFSCEHLLHKIAYAEKLSIVIYCCGCKICAVSYFANKDEATGFVVPTSRITGVASY